MDAVAARTDRPTTDVDTQAWWTAVQDRSLMLDTCGSCGRNSLSIKPFCQYCWSEDLTGHPASGRARLYTWSVVHQNAAPFAERVPYIVAMVDLAEGPRLMSVVEGCSAEQLSADMPLQLAFRTDDDGYVVPVFRPETVEIT